MEIATRKIEREYEEQQAHEQKLQEEVTPMDDLLYLFIICCLNSSCSS